MSIQFNDTEYRKGLVQFYEKETERDFGEVSGNTNRLKDFAADTALALDELFNIAAAASASGEIDDARHDKYPLIQIDIESGKSKYTFSQDEDGNFILEYHDVVFKTLEGERISLVKHNPQYGVDKIKFIQDAESGIPSEYIQTANGIILDKIPSFTLENGIELLVNVEPLYFQYSDTDVFAGIPGDLHPWLYIHPAEAYARRKGLKNYTALAREKAILEQKIKNKFIKRTRDERPRVRAMYQNNH